jgi:hypothetical protein
MTFHIKFHFHIIGLYISQRINSDISLLLLYNIGVIHTRNWEHTKALEYYFRALERNPFIWVTERRTMCCNMHLGSKSSKKIVALWDPKFTNLKQFGWAFIKFFLVRFAKVFFMWDFIVFKRTKSLIYAYSIMKHKVHCFFDCKGKGKRNCL